LYKIKSKQIKEMSMAAIYGAPGKCTPSLSVKIENNFVYNNGATIEVRLIIENNVPCSSPCSFCGTVFEILDWRAGGAITLIMINEIIA
jgi:hypothetical protein